MQGGSAGYDLIWRLVLSHEVGSILYCKCYMYTLHTHTHTHSHTRGTICVYGRVLVDAIYNSVYLCTSLCSGLCAVEHAVQSVCAWVVYVRHTAETTDCPFLFLGA